MSKIEKISNTLSRGLHRGPEFEVLWSVVVSNPILVVNVLCGKEISTENLLHDNPVLKLVDVAADTEHHIAIRSYSTLRAWSTSSIKSCFSVASVALVVQCAPTSTAVDSRPLTLWMPAESSCRHPGSCSLRWLVCASPLSVVRIAPATSNLRPITVSYGARKISDWHVDILPNASVTPRATDQTRQLREQESDRILGQ